MPHKAFEVIKALPPDIAALFSNTPNSLLISAGGVEYVMSQVKIHSGVRPGDEIKEVMDRVYDVVRRKDEALATFVIRCTQEWNLAERRGICKVPDTMKLHMLKKGAKITESQNNQYHIITNQNPWDLRFGIHALNVVDQCAHDQSGSSRTSRVYVVEDDEQHSLMGEEDYEDDVVDVLVNFGGPRRS